MFMGEFTHTLDDKGRLTIPAKFRDELAGGAVVTRGFEQNLLIYPSAVFQHLSARTRAMSPTDPEIRALLRLTFSGASDDVLDKQGRIIIPPYLRAYASLTNGECVVVGIGDYIEVWSQVGWAEQLKTINDPQLNARRFTALNLAMDAPTALSEG